MLYHVLNVKLNQWVRGDDGKRRMFTREEASRFLSHWNQDIKAYKLFKVREGETA